MLVNANDMYPYWALREVELAFDEIDRLFFSGFESYLTMTGPAPTHCSRASFIFEAYAGSF